MTRQKGFTLVELLIVVSIAALIGMLIYTMFASGIDMMRRISQTVTSEEVDFFWERVDREISSQVFYEGVAFEASAESFRFPAPIETGGADPAERGIGRVTLSYNDSDNVIERRQENLAHFFDEKEGGGTLKVLLKDVTEARFQYLVYRKAERIYEWVEEWNSAEQKGMIPFAVKIELTCERGGEKYGSQRTIPIPIAESKR